LIKLKNDLEKVKGEEQQSKSHYDSIIIERQSMTTLVKELQTELEEEKNTIDNLNKTYSTNTNDYASTSLQSNKLAESILDFKNKRSLIAASTACSRSVTMTCEDGSVPVVIMDSWNKMGVAKDSFNLAVSSDTLPKLQAI